MSDDFVISGDFSEYDNLGIVLVDCTCKHEFEDHTWGHCEVEYCDCEGGWEE